MVVAIAPGTATITANKGFLVTYKLGDHRNNPFPLRQTNGVTHSPNVLHNGAAGRRLRRLFRRQGTRHDGASSGTDRLAHHLAWHARLDHTDRQADRRHGDLAHRYRLADHRRRRQHRLPKSAAIAKNPQRPTCNDGTAFDRGYGSGAREPVRVESTARTGNLPSGFFPAPWIVTRPAQSSSSSRSR